jgi:hypothetical protein
MESLPPPDRACLRRVHSFAELLATPFSGQVNALCWERRLAGNFGEIVARLAERRRPGETGENGEGITRLDAELLHALPLSPAGRIAVEQMLADHRLLSDRGLSPELNFLRFYPREENPGIVRTDVYSFHADRAPVEADTWLCTYHGAPSEGLPNAEVRRFVEIPEVRTALLREFGREDDGAFREFLSDNCYDLHFAPRPGAQPYSFGVGHLWRIATEYPGSPVPPCVHRAPDNLPGQPPRLLLIA